MISVFARVYYDRRRLGAALTLLQSCGMLGIGKVTRVFTPVVLYAFLLLAFALRVFALQSDPPSLDVLPDMASWTDEGTISLPAVMSLRGQEIPDRLVVSGRPLHVLALSFVFDVLGIGRFQGRLISVAVGILGLVALARVATQVSKYGVTLALACAGIGFFFVIYDRLILTEGLVVTALCLTMWFGLGVRRARSAFAVGITLGLIAVTLKFHALLLLPGLGLLYLLRRRHLLLPFLLGVGTMLFVWRMFWLAGNNAYIGYMQERVGGESLGIAPLEIGILQIFLMGASWYFLPYQLPLFLLASLEILAFLLSPRRWLHTASDPIFVALAWLATVVIVVGLFRYTPTRYYHIASPAIVLLGIAGAKRLWYGQPFPRVSAVVRLLCATTLGLILLAQFVPVFPALGEWKVGVPLLGLPFPFIFLWLTTRNLLGWGWSQKTRSALLAVLIIIQMLEQVGLYVVGVLPARMELPQAATALANQAPQNAVVVGRLAGTLALLAPLQGYPMLDRIDQDVILELARTRSVWIVTLDQDEYRVDSRLRYTLVKHQVFPINYSSTSRWFTVYQYRPSTNNLE